MTETMALRLKALTHERLKALRANTLGGMTYDQAVNMLLDHYAATRGMQHGSASNEPAHA